MLKTNSAIHKTRQNLDEKNAIVIQSETTIVHVIIVSNTSSYSLLKKA